MKRKLLLAAAMVALILFAGVAVRKTGQSLRAYVEYERTASNSEQNILREMRIGHNDNFPGIYVWLGDDHVIVQDLADARAVEEATYGSIGRFVLPLTHNADLRKCVTGLHAKRLDSLRALDRMTASHQGPDELGDRYLAASVAYRGQLATCGVLLGGFSPSDISSGQQTPDAPAQNKLSVPTASGNTSGIEHTYKAAYSRLRSSKSTADIADADITDLADILAHPTTEADWKFLSELDANATDPANSCDTADCAIDQNIVGKAEQMIKSAGLVPPPSMSIHFKLVS
ncbi:hypothetical protein P3T23_004417 [Paraburkholderia sp. GAS448]|uniref:hypothetical protein n=1 Tax=Paraburkholderia sp. GAS448 TaxID=3035136 RepID=UPI003D19BB90